MWPNLFLIVVNLLQIYLLDKFEKKSGYIILSSPAVLVVGYILVLCYNFFRDAKTRESWRNAKSEQEHHMSLHHLRFSDTSPGTQKAAWIGAITAVTLPFIICHFCYLMLWGFPDYHTTKWTAEVVNNMVTGLPPPSLYISGAIGSVFEQPDCTIYNQTGDLTYCTKYMSTDMVDPVDGSPVQLFHVPDGSTRLKGQGYFNYIDIQAAYSFQSKKAYFSSCFVSRKRTNRVYR